MDKKATQYEENFTDIIFKVDKTYTKARLFIGNRRVIVMDNVEKITIDIDGDVKILEPR